MFGLDEDGMIAWLRRRYPTKPAQGLAAEIGASVDTAANWLNGAARPSVTWFGVMVVAFGPDFLRAALKNPPAWLDAARLEEERIRLRAEIRLREQRLNQL